MSEYLKIRVDDLDAQLREMDRLLANARDAIVPLEAERAKIQAERDEIAAYLDKG